MKRSLAVLIPLAALCACAPVREELLPSEGAVVANSICAVDGRALAFAFQDRRTTCEPEQLIGSLLRSCVCRDLGPRTEAAAAPELARSGAGPSVRTGGK